MLAVFAVILAGIVTGRLCRGRRLAFVPRLITGVIWALLFLLGIEVGADPAVVGGMATLGVAAFVVFAGAVAGSMAAAWLLWRVIRRRVAARRADGTEGEHAACGGDIAAREPAPAASLWDTLRGSLVIVAFFVAGVLAGLCLPPRALPAGASTAVLYLLMYCVGITLGHDETLARRVRRLDPRLALLPLATAVGTLAGAALVTPLLGAWSVTDSLAVGAGFGYYSLSSIFIADMRGPELGYGRPAVQRHAGVVHAAGRAARGPLGGAAGRRVNRRGHDLRHDAARHHAGRRSPLCRGVDLPRLRARFQCPVSGDALLFACIDAARPRRRGPVAIF